MILVVFGDQVCVVVYVGLFDDCAFPVQVRGGVSFGDVVEILFL
jgi:hypothetical protein